MVKRSKNVGKITVTSVKSLLTVERPDSPLVYSFSNKGLFLNGHSPIIMCLYDFEGTHSGYRQLGNNPWSCDGYHVAWCVVMRRSFGILSDVALVDTSLFSDTNLLPINSCFNRHEHVSSEYQLSWGEAKGGVISTSNSIGC